MNQVRRKSSFWRLAGPLLAYLGIQWVVQTLAQTVISFPYIMRAYMDAIQSGTRDLSEIYMNALEPAVEAMLKYQVEIMGISSLCTLVLTGILFGRDRKKEKAAGIAPGKKAPLYSYWKILLFGIAGCIAATCLMVMAQAAFSDAQYEQTAQVMYSAGFPMQILVLGIVVPVAEELMFRGILFKRFRETQGFWYSALCSSLLFCLMHTNMTQMIYTFLLGLMLSYLYEKYNSFRAPLFLHIVVNCASVIFTAAGVFTWLGTDPMRMAGASIGGAFICSAVFVLIQRMEGPKDKETPPDKPDPLDMFR